MDELNKIPIFALEGSAFAGKTTLLNYIKDNYGERINVIPEVGEYVGGDKNFPDIPFRSLSDAKYSTYFFEEIEKIRYKDIINLYKKNKRPILIDRFTFLSSLIFYKLLIKNKIQSKEMFTDFYNHATSIFNSSMTDSSIRQPNGFIFIKHINKRVFNSRLSRGTKNSVFTTWDNCKYVNKLYSKFFKELPDDVIKSLYSSNSNLDQNAQEIVEFVENNKDRPVINFSFNNALSIQETTENDRKVAFKARSKARYLVNKSKTI